MKKMGEKWSPSCFLLLKRTLVVLKGGEGNTILYKITKMPLLMPLCVIFFNLPDCEYSHKAFPNSD